MPISVSMRKRLRNLFILLLLILVGGFLIPERFTLPVEGLAKADYNQKSFWAYPWGKSVTHKGVDIFAKSGSKVLSPIDGIVIRTGNSDRAGNFIAILGPKWRVHYHAHLASSVVKTGQRLKPGDYIGTVGATGNAQGKAPHLHYSIYSMIPLPWRYDDSIQGWKKAFFINPIPYLNSAF